MGGVVFDLYPHKCKECGKAFEAGLEWAYKKPDKYKRHLYWFCSWHCLQDYRRKLKK